jgi:hypothetical protein
MSNSMKPDDKEVITALEHHISRQRAEIEGLVLGLKTYGCHTFDCALPDTHGEKPCSCGWSEAIGRVMTDYKDLYGP